MTNLDALLIIAYKILYFLLLRNSAQVQLLTIVLVLLASWFVDRRLARALYRALPAAKVPLPVDPAAIEQEYSAETDQWNPEEPSPPAEVPPPAPNWQQRLTKFAYIVLPELLMPVTAILFTALASSLLVNLGYFVGLLTHFSWLLLLLLGYRLLVGIITFVLPEQYAFRYHFQLLLPLFVLYVLYQILSWFIDPRILGNIVVFDLFDNPVTWGNIFVATVGFYLWLQLARLLQDILYFLITHYTNAQPGTANATLTLVRYGFVVIGIVLVFNALQFNSSTVAAIAAGVSAGAAFASREILNNFIGGIILLFEQSIRPGDTIEIGPDMGVVTAVNIRSTVVQAYDGREIIVPNSQVLTSSVITHTKTSRYTRIKIDLGVSYSANLRQVLEILRQIPAQHENVLDDPEPNAFLVGFGDSSVNFTLFAWVADISLKFVTTHELYFMIWDEFARHGIEIPFPQQDLHIRDTAGLRVETSAEAKPMPPGS